MRLLIQHRYYNCNKSHHNIGFGWQPQRRKNICTVYGLRIEEVFLFQRLPVHSAADSVKSLQKIRLPGRFGGKLKHFLCIFIFFNYIMFAAQMVAENHQISESRIRIEKAQVIALCLEWI